jgi:hypothetical protein
MGAMSADRYIGRGARACKVYSLAMCKYQRDSILTHHLNRNSQCNAQELIKAKRSDQHSQERDIHAALAFGQWGKRDTQ